MNKYTTYIFLSVLVTLFSCVRDAEQTSDSGTTNPNSAFQKTAGWPDSIKMRRVGDSFQETIAKVEVDKTGAIWALRVAKPNPDESNYKKYLEKYDVLGNLVLSIPEKTGTILHSFVVHPSGELTIMELRTSIGDSLESNIWLKRIRADGSTLIETALRDREKPEKKYDDADINFGYPAELIPAGENVYLAAYTHGVKLYNFSSNLEMSWSRQVMPLLAYVSGRKIKLALDEFNNIHVALSLWHQSEITAWENHFAKTLARESAVSSFFIAGFSPKGDLKISRAFGKDHALYPAGLAVKDGTLTAVSTSRIQNKFKDSNHTQEWNIIFFRAEMNSGRILDYKVLETQRDTYISDFRVNAAGHSYITGTNDFIQVNTGSVVEFGQAYILKVDEHGRKLSYLNFRGHRHTRIESIALLGLDRLIFGGFFNGPITHTGDADKKQNFQWGMLGVAGIN